MIKLISFNPYPRRFDQVYKTAHRLEGLRGTNYFLLDLIWQKPKVFLKNKKFLNHISFYVKMDINLNLTPIFRKPRPEIIFEKTRLLS